MWLERKIDADKSEYEAQKEYTCKHSVTHHGGNRRTGLSGRWVVALRRSGRSRMLGMGCTFDLERLVRSGGESGLTRDIRWDCWSGFKRSARLMYSTALNILTFWAAST